MIRRLGRSAALLPAACGFLVLCVYLLTGSSDLGHNGDTDLRWQTTQAIVDFHRLWIAHPMWLDTRVALGRGGHLYAFYAPGQEILMIPLYVAGRFLAHHLALPYTVTTLYAARSLDLWLGALLAALVCRFALDLGYSRRVSIAVTLVFAFASVAWPDAQSALEQTQVDLFVCIGAWALYRWHARGGHGDGWLLLAGTGAGMALWTRYDAALFLLPFAVFIALRNHWLVRRTIRDLAVLAGGAAPWALFVLAWDWARFGSPFLTGLHEKTLGEPILEGLVNLVVSPGKGLLWYLPLLFLLPPAAVQFWRREPHVAVFFAMLAGLPLLFYANVLYWHGDPAWGPRYLYVAVPYLVLPLGELLSSWGRMRILGRMAIAVVVALSLAVQLAAVSVTEWRFWYELQSDQQRTFDAATWKGQPFHWGAEHYHYYWDVAESPVLRQFENVFQVAGIQMGDRQYVLTAKPDPYTGSNPADFYPVNDFAFWWVDPKHPLLGPHTREGIAGLLALLALLSGLLLIRLAGEARGAAVGQDARRPALAGANPPT